MQRSSSKRPPAPPLLWKGVWVEFQFSYTRKTRSIWCWFENESITDQIDTGPSLSQAALYPTSGGTIVWEKKVAAWNRKVDKVTRSMLRLHNTWSLMIDWLIDWLIDDARDREWNLRCEKSTKKKNNIPPMRSAPQQSDKERKRERERDPTQHFLSSPCSEASQKNMLRLVFQILCAYLLLAGVVCNSVVVRSHIRRRHQVGEEGGWWGGRCRDLPRMIWESMENVWKESKKRGKQTQNGFE